MKKSRIPPGGFSSILIGWSHRKIEKWYFHFWDTLLVPSSKIIAVTDFILKVNLTFIIIIRWNYTQTTITRAPMPNVHKSVICAKCTVPCERTNWSITVVWFPILLAFINNQSVGRPFQSLVQMGLLYMWHTRRLSHLCPGSLST